MKNIKIKSIILMISILTILSCVTVMASDSISMLYNTQKQGEKTKLNIGIENLPKNTVSVEISLSGESIKSFENIEWKNNMNAKVLHKKENEKIILYIVSNNKEEPLSQGENVLYVASMTFNDMNMEKITANIKYIDTKLETKSVNGIKLVESEQATQTTTRRPVYFPPTTTEMTTETTTEGTTESTTEEKIETTTEKETKEETTETTTEEQTTKTEEIIKKEFSDTKVHWASEPIANMTQKGYLSGYDDGSFKPNNIMTRAEFSSVMARIFDLKPTGAKTPFIDIVKGAWYEDATKSMYENGIIMGIDNNTYGVNNPMKNQDLAVMLERIIKKFNVHIPVVKTDEISFLDKDKIRDYAKPSVQFLYERGLLYGNADGTYAPQDETTRAQIAAFLDRLLPYIEENN